MYRTNKGDTAKDLTKLKDLGIPLNKWVNVSDEVYHNEAPGISASGLKSIKGDCLAIYRYKKDNASTEKSEALVVGSATHKYILEGPSFNDEYRFSSESDKRKPAWKSDFKKATEDNVILLRNSDKELLEGMMESLCEPIAEGINTFDAFIGNELAEIEKAMFVHDKERDIIIKVKADINLEGKVLDLKSTKCAKPKAFMKDAANLSYPLQASFYLNAMKMADLPAIAFGFIAIEKVPPYLHQTILMPNHIIEMENVRMNRLLDSYAKAFHSGEWYGYIGPDANTGKQPIFIIGEMPGWYVFELEEENDFEGK